MAPFNMEISDVKTTGLKEGEWLDIYWNYSPDLKDEEILAVGEIDGRAITAAKKKTYNKEK